MRIVDLNGGIIVQVMEITAAFCAFFQNHLCAGTDHQILLVNPQKTSGIVAVVRVKEQRQVLCYVRFVKADAVSDTGTVNAVQVEQVQVIGAAFISCDSDSVKPGSVILARQGYRVGNVCFLCPVMLSQPEIRSLILQAMGEVLMEQTAVISEAYAVSGKIQGGHRIQEAGSQPAQASVAQAGLRLYFFKFRHGFAVCLQAGFYLVVKSQVDEIIAQ